MLYKVLGRTIQLFQTLPQISGLSHVTGEHWGHPAALALLWPHRQNQSVSEPQTCVSWLTPVAGDCWSPCDLMSEDRTFPDMGRMQSGCPEDGQAL